MFKQSENTRRIRERLAGREVSRADEIAARIAAVQYARQHRPYIFVFNPRLFKSGSIVANSSPLRVIAPAHGGQRFDLLLFSAITDIETDGVISCDILQRFRMHGAEIAESIFDEANRPGYIAGDFRATGRTNPAKWFDLPEPICVRENTSLTYLIEATGALQELADFRFVMQGVRTFPNESAESSLPAAELAAVTEQITTRRPRTIIAAVDVDLENGDLGLPVQLPDLGEWAYLLGFASGTEKLGGGDFLQFSDVAISDPNGYDFSNAPFPFASVAALPFDVDNKQEWYRLLRFPYLVGPNREQPAFTFTNRGDLEPDTQGKLVAIFRTV